MMGATFILFVLVCIQSRSGTEPGNLLFIISMLYSKCFFSPILMQYTYLQGTSGCKLLQADNREAVLFADTVIVRLVYECRGSKTKRTQLGRARR